MESYDRDVPNNYDITTAFVRYHRPSREEWQEAIEYVADVEDETWLTNNTKFGGALHPLEDQEDKKEEATTDVKDASATTEINATTAPDAKEGAENEEKNPVQRSRLPLEVFEHIMDLLEKATAFDAIVSNGQAEQLVYEKVPLLD